MFLLFPSPPLLSCSIWAITNHHHHHHNPDLSLLFICKRTVLRDNAIRRNSYSVSPHSRRFIRSTEIVSNKWNAVLFVAWKASEVTELWKHLAVVLFSDTQELKSNRLTKTLWLSSQDRRTAVFMITALCAKGII